MKNFKIFYTVITQSRCGAYAYHFNKIIEAKTEEEAKAILTNQPKDFKRYKLVFNKVTEVA